MVISIIIVFFIIVVIQNGVICFEVNIKVFYIYYISELIRCMNGVNGVCFFIINLVVVIINYIVEFINFIVCVDIIEFEMFLQCVNFGSEIFFIISI